MEIFAKKTVYCERNTVVTVVKADRAVDTGTYKIRLVCEGGTFEVLVLLIKFQKLILIIEL